MICVPRPSSVFIALQIIASLSNVVTAMRLEGLERRAPQTNAICSAEYAWADNSKKRSPCMMAAEVLAPCNGGSWTVPALVAANQSYTNPGLDGTIANACSCSWLAYNLISACSDCQGNPQSVKIWSDYSNRCTEYPSTSFYPPGYLPSDVLIPAWALTDPNQWSDRRYTATQARAVAQEGRAEVGGLRASDFDNHSEKKDPLGLIIGLVLGGIGLLGALGGFFYYLLRRSRQTPASKFVDDSDCDFKEDKHHRNLSETTMDSLSYSSVSSPISGPAPVRTSTIRTHVSSSNDFSVLGSHHRISSIYTTAPSPPPGSLVLDISPNRADFIRPFSLQYGQSDSMDSFNRDRKSTGGPITMYDPPTARPAMGEDVLFELPERARLSPPAYSPYQSNTPTRRSTLTTERDAILSYISHDLTGSNDANAANDTGSGIFTTDPMDGDTTVIGESAPTQITTYPPEKKRRRTEDSITTPNFA